jgi:hypothetical protein
MTELVEQQRAEEGERRHDRHRQIGRLRKMRVLRRKDRAGERPGDEREDDQPAPVDADPDAGDPAE